MRSILKKITLFVFLVNLLLTSFTVYIFFVNENNDSSKRRTEEWRKNKDLFSNDDNWNPFGYDLFDDRFDDKANQDKSVPLSNNGYNNETFIPIEIWSKAAIGTYLWEHILKAKIDRRSESQFYVYGFKKIRNFKLKFRSGPSLNAQSLRQFLTKNVKHSFDDKSQELKRFVLIINGRDESKIKFSKHYLNVFREMQMNENAAKYDVGIVMLGNENCFNNWINPYLKKHGGFVKFLFVVYDWSAVDNRDIYQWPLGVATYRNFPNPDGNKMSLHLNRPYVCNFFGTIYNNTSREELFNLLQKHEAGKRCLIKPRWEWKPNESKESLQHYVEALKLSDLTLSPIGMNHECYRIYEAISYGSVPVLEENLNHISGKKSSCDHSSAYRLLKEWDAPVIYVKNWTQDLLSLLKTEAEMRLELKVRRRVSVLNWYNRFKRKIGDRFLSVIEEHFLYA